MRKLQSFFLISILLLPTLLIFLPSANASPTITRVQGNVKATGFNASYLNINLTATPQTGNTLIAAVGLQSVSNALKVSSINQTGVTWTLQKANTLSNAAGGGIFQSVEIWLGLISEDASEDFTIYFNATAGSISIADVCEYNNILTISPLDVSAQNNTLGSQLNVADTGTTTVTSQGEELWVGAIIAGGATRTLTDTTNDFTLLDGQSNGYGGTLGYLEKIVTETGTANSQVQLGSYPDCYWASVICAFKASPVFTYSTPTPTTLYAGRSFSLSTMVTDSVFDLSHYIWQTNITGTPQNSTAQTFISNPISLNAVWNSTVGVTIEVTLFVNDTGGFTSTQTWNYTLTDGDEPTYSNLGYSTTTVGTLCYFTCLWSNNDAPDGFIFSQNITGTWVNSSWTPLSGTNPAWANISMALPLTVGQVVGYEFLCNDTAGLWGTTGIHTLTVTAPPVTPTTPPSFGGGGGDTVLPTPTPPLSAMQLDIIILSTSITPSLFGSEMPIQVMVINKGTTAADIELNWILYDSNNHTSASGTQTIFISGLDTKNTTINIPKVNYGQYSLTVYSTSPYASATAPLTISSVTPLSIMQDGGYAVAGVSIIIIVLALLVLLLFWRKK